MRVRGILLTVLVVLLGGFGILNWGTLVAPLPVDLLLLRIEVPVGLILLAVTVGLAVVFFAGALFDRASQLREIRHLEKQLEATRARLDARSLKEMAEVRDAVQAWGSALETQIDERVGRAETSLGEALAESDARGAQRLAALEARVVTVRNELAADVGEAEDTLRRLLGQGMGALPSPTDGRRSDGRET